MHGQEGAGTTHSGALGASGAPLEDIEVLRVLVGGGVATVPQGLSAAAAFCSGGQGRAWPTLSCVWTKRNDACPRLGASPPSALFRRHRAASNDTWIRRRWCLAYHIGTTRLCVPDVRTWLRSLVGPITLMH